MSSAAQDYCNFNRVHMAYCDGNSFSGNADEPVTVNGKKIYFRGKRISKYKHSPPQLDVHRRV